MAYQVTYTMNVAEFDANVPSMEEFISTLDGSILNDYPQYDGMSLQQAYNTDATAHMADASHGFISETLESNDDQTTNTLVHLWESQQDYEDYNLFRQYGDIANLKVGTGTVSSTTGSAVVTGAGTAFTTEFKENYTVVVDSSGTKVELGTVSSVDSDTQMTLKSTSAVSVTDVVFGVRPQMTLSGYISKLLSEQHPYDTNLTFANV